MKSLFHTLSIILANCNTYIFENSGDFHIHTKQTHIRYREAINPIFHLYFPNGLEGIQLSYEPKYVIPGKSYPSSKPLADSDNNDILDYIDFYKKRKGTITVLASAFSKYNHNNYTLWLDNNLLDIAYYKNLTHFQHIYINPGPHRLTLKCHTIFKVSENKGYTNSYQIGLWDGMPVEYNSPISVKVRNNNSIQLNIIEYTVYYEGEYYNDLINSQPKSAQTHFHI